jgi:tetratricopeptide (TPR) repeat protein
MKNTFWGLLILSMMLGGSAFSQKPGDELHSADSLIRLGQFQNALTLVNGVIENKTSRFVLSNAYFRLGHIYLGLKDFDKAVYYNKQSLDIRNNLMYELISENYLLFGLIELKKENDDLALNHFLKASELPFESYDYAGLVYAYIALTYYRKGEIEQVLHNYKIAMKTWMTAYKEGQPSDINRFRVRRNKLYYDNFFVGYL